MKATSKLDSSNKEENTELVKRYEIEDSPFTIIGLPTGEKKKEKYFGVMGKYRVTLPNESKDAIEAELKDVTWNRIIQVILILMETDLNIKDKILKTLQKQEKENLEVKEEI